MYSVTTIKKGYGFRVLLKFADGSDTTQQHAGFCNKAEANAQRDEIIRQLHAGTYIVYGKIKISGLHGILAGRLCVPGWRITATMATKMWILQLCESATGKMYM